MLWRIKIVLWAVSFGLMLAAGTASIALFYSGDPIGVQRQAILICAGTVGLVGGVSILWAAMRMATPTAVIRRAVADLWRELGRTIF